MAEESEVFADKNQTSQQMFLLQVADQSKNNVSFMFSRVFSAHSVSVLITIDSMFSLQVCRFKSCST